MADRRHKVAVALHGAFVASPDLRGDVVKAATVLKEYPWSGDVLQALSTAALSLAAGPTSPQWESSKKAFTAAVAAAPSQVAPGVTGEPSRESLVQLFGKWMRPEEVLDVDVVAFWLAEIKSPRASLASILAAVHRRHPEHPRRQLLADCLGLPQTVLQVWARTSLGLLAEAAPSFLQRLVDESASYSFPDAVYDAVAPFVAQAPAFDAAFDDVIAVAEQLTPFDGPAAVRYALRDNRATLKEISKLTTSRRTELLEKWGVSSNDANRLSFVIFQRARKTAPNEHISATKLQHAIGRIAEEDRSLDFSHCGLTAATVKPIVQQIIATSCVVNLDLSANDLHAAGAEEVSQVVRHVRSLRSLNVGGNNVQTSGLKAIVAAAAARHHGLEMLDVSCGHIGVDGMRVLAPWLSRGVFRKLNVASNSLTSSVDLLTFEFLCQNTLLSSLDVSSNSLGDRGFQHLAVQLRANVGLVSLKVANNGISRAGLRVLTESLASHPCLQELDVSYHPLLGSDWYDVESLVAANSNITSVVCDFCGAHDRLRFGSANAEVIAKRTAELIKTGVANFTADDVDFWSRVVLRNGELAAALRGMKGSVIAGLTDTKVQALGLSDQGAERLISAVRSGVS